MTGMRSEWGGSALRLAALSLGVLALAFISITFTADSRVAAIWPANALALAFLLSTPQRFWPISLLAAMGGYIGANLIDGGPVAPALALALANGTETLLAALLCRPAIGSDIDVTRPRQLLTLGAAAAVAPLASALIALTVFPGGGDTFVRWYLADALGLILVTPALLALAGDFGSLRKVVRQPEALAPLLTLAAALAVVFSQSDYPLLFLIFPPLIWCAFTLGAAGTAVALLATTVAAIYATLGGYGAAARIDGDLQTKLTVLQILLACITLVTLPLTAVLAERRRLDASLREALAKANDSEARYRMLADNASDMIFRYDADGAIRYASPSVAKLGYSPDELVGRASRDFVHPDDAPALDARIQEMLRTGQVEPVERAFRFLARNGDYVWVEANPSIIFDDAGKPVSFVSQVRDISARKASEEALAESEARYRALADNASDIVLRFRAGAIIDYASPSVASLGYSPDELVGVSGLDMIHPDDVAEVADRIRTMLETGSVDPARERIYRVRTKSGGYVWIEGNPTVVRDDAGQPVGVVTQLRDVTSRRDAELALAASEARYRMLADNASDLVIKIDDKGVLTYVSPSVRRLGYEPDDLIGQSPLSLVHPEDRDAAGARMIERRKSGLVEQGAAITYRVLAKDGGHIWVESNSSVVRNADGSLSAIISQLRDVTARHTQELVLAESEARYRMLADHATDVIIKVDAEDVLLYASPSVRRYGYDPEKILGTSGYTLVHPDDRPKLQELIGELFRTGLVDASRDRTYRLRKADGEGWVWMEGNPSLVRNESGEIEAVISQLRDVSVRMELEAELLAARDDAQAAAATKAEFMANMSHEIRTPLTAVLGFTGLLASRSGLPDDARRQVGRIGAAGEAMLAIVNDILDFSKLEAGLMPVTPRPAQPMEMLENALALFEPQAAAKGLRLTLAAKDLPDHASLDPDRVRQVLLNLIGNAVKFTETGSVDVTAAYEDGRLKVAVRDTGAGMDEAQQARLFQRFSQVDGAAARAGGGTGLGLAISLGLVEAMGGKIGLTSAPGQGSTFAFEIPAPTCAAETEAVEAVPATGVAGLRVLLADDNPTNRELACAVMAQFDIEVTDASDGAEAVELAAILPYDVILLDVRMPLMDGPTAARRIRGEAGPNQATPILAFSADHDLEPDIADLFDGLVRKPIEVTSLLDALAQVTDWEAALYTAEA